MTRPNQKSPTAKDSRFEVRFGQSGGDSFVHTVTMTTRGAANITILGDSAMTESTVLDRCLSVPPHRPVR
jgi:hypothetical protein